MRMKFLMTSILFVLSANVFSQNLSLDMIISLRTKNLVDVEEYLTAKGWSLIGSTEQSESSMGYISFAYNKNIYDDKAESFIKYIYSETTGRKRISWQLNRKDKYNAVLNQLKSKGVKLISSKIEDGSIVKCYQNSTLTFKISINVEEGDFATVTNYTILVLTNSDYLLNFSE